MPRGIEESRNHGVNRVAHSTDQRIRAVPHFLPKLPYLASAARCSGHAARWSSAERWLTDAGVRGAVGARTAPARAARPKPDGDGRVSLRWLDGRCGIRRRVLRLAVPGGNWHWAYLYQQYGALPQVQQALAGMSSVAAGLLFATAVNNCHGVVAAVATLAVRHAGFCRVSASCAGRSCGS